ncbi:MAG: DUF4291 family protein [Pirellulaceae bacterium]|nr:DUF4291 family protein [Pirellulaceae bacterium]
MLRCASIQVGLSREIIREFTDQWVLDTKDWTARAKRIRSLILSGNQARSKAMFPREREYSVSYQDRAQWEVDQ